MRSRRQAKPAPARHRPGVRSGHTIYLDANAAGWGWFVDPSPWDDSEFTTPGNPGEQRRMGLPAVRRGTPLGDSATLAADVYDTGLLFVSDGSVTGDRYDA